MIFLMAVMNEMETMESETEAEIQEDVALAQADVGDDLSFYYD